MLGHTALPRKPLKQGAKAADPPPTPLCPSPTINWYPETKWLMDTERLRLPKIIATPCKAVCANSHQHILSQSPPNIPRVASVCLHTAVMKEVLHQFRAEGWGGNAEWELESSKQFLSIPVAGKPSQGEPFPVTGGVAGLNQVETGKRPGDRQGIVDS